MNVDDFPKIKQWAQIRLDYLMEEVNQTCDRLLTNDDDKKKSAYEKMILVGKDPSQSWLSKQEMIDAYDACWGLFAEHLGNLMLDDPWVYFGYLQMNILRTFRIIADILLHIEGRTPEQVVQLAQQYLTKNLAGITAEVYRYQVLPGQACSYKTGLEVFKTIIEKKFKVTNVKDFVRADLLDWYKEILWEAERPLDLLLRENQVMWTFEE